MKQIHKIAILLTCYNRKDKTLSCLNSLNDACSYTKLHVDVYLVDDGSNDGTGEAVKLNFPNVNVINGDGNLFWNKGMRLAWETAVSNDDYDFFMWLNDDTILFKDSLNELFDSYYSSSKLEKKPTIVTGACCTDESMENFSYGGRDEEGQILPNGDVQKCKYINGNAVIVPKEIFSLLGFLSEDYTHAMGDFDYGLRAYQIGYSCYTTRKYVAICPKNEGIPPWCNPEIPLMKRIKFLNSPKGLNLKEYNKFRRKFWGRLWVIFAIKAYLKTIFPRTYLRLQKKETIIRNYKINLYGLYFNFVLYFIFR